MDLGPIGSRAFAPGRVLTLDQGSRNTVSYVADPRPELHLRRDLDLDIAARASTTWNTLSEACDTSGVGAQDHSKRYEMSPEKTSRSPKTGSKRVAPDHDRAISPPPIKRKAQAAISSTSLKTDWKFASSFQRIDMFCRKRSGQLLYADVEKTQGSHNLGRTRSRREAPSDLAGWKVHAGQ